MTIQGTARGVLAARGSAGARQRLALPLALEDGRPPKTFDAALYIICGLLVALLIWACLSQIREVAIAPGEISPAGSVHAIQHLEGGIVEEILVRAGQVVAEGAPILRMKQESSSSDLDQLTTRAAALKIRALRLRAELDGTEPDFSAYADRYSTIVADQITRFEAGQLNRASQRVLLDAKIAQRDAELAANEAEIEALKVQVEISSEQLEIQEQLLEKGYTAKKVFLTTKADHQRAEAAYVGATAQRLVARQALAQAIAERDNATALARNDAAEEFAQVTAEIAELDESLKRHFDRHDRLVVRAPVAGIVKDILPSGAGSVVRSGDTVAEIVPNSENLVAEVEINPSDIGHVRLGHPAEVSVTTFDANLFGKLAGHVSHISASTFKRERDDTPYFKAVVTLEDDAVGSGALHRPLQAGMVVQAEIITGEKSLARYMLKPIYRSLDTAFSER